MCVCVYVCVCVCVRARQSNRTKISDGFLLKKK